MRRHHCPHAWEPARQQIRPREHRIHARRCRIRPSPTRWRCHRRLDRPPIPRSEQQSRPKNTAQRPRRRHPRGRSGPPTSPSAGSGEAKEGGSWAAAAVSFGRLPSRGAGATRGLFLRQPGQPNFFEGPLASHLSSRSCIGACCARSVTQMRCPSRPFHASRRQNDGASAPAPSCREPETRRQAATPPATTTTARTALERATRRGEQAGGRGGARPPARCWATDTHAMIDARRAA
jgi:hypothetical protein